MHTVASHSAPLLRYKILALCTLACMLLPHPALAQCHNLVLSSNDESMGGCAVLATQCDQQTVIAVPYTCNRFVRWSDGNTQLWRTVELTADSSLTAYFEPDENHLWNIVATAYPPHAADVYAPTHLNCSDTLIIRIVPHEGWSVSHWIYYRPKYNHDSDQFELTPEHLSSADGHTAIRTRLSDMLILPNDTSYYSVYLAPDREIRDNSRVITYEYTCPSDNDTQNGDTYYLPSDYTNFFNDAANDTYVEPTLIFYGWHVNSN